MYLSGNSNLLRLPFFNDFHSSSENWLGFSKVFISVSYLFPSWTFSSCGIHPTIWNLSFQKLSLSVYVSPECRTYWQDKLYSHRPTVSLCLPLHEQHCPRISLQRMYLHHQFILLTSHHNSLYLLPLAPKDIRRLLFYLVSSTQAALIHLSARICNDSCLLVDYVYKFYFGYNAMVCHILVIIHTYSTQL